MTAPSSLRSRPPSTGRFGVAQCGLTMLAALRSSLFVAWSAATLVAYALAVLLASLFTRGDALASCCTSRSSAGPSAGWT